MQAPIIIKFGGSSLQDPAALLHVQEIIKSINPRPVVVLSAMGGITDSLLDGIKAATTGND
jgi:aspartokinase